MRVTRRGILIGALAGGGLAIGYALRPRRYAPPLSARADEAAFGAWLRIGKDGVVTVAVPQLEMGQGITTLLAQVVAVELGADWRQVAVEPAPPSALYANLPLAARWAALWMPLFPQVASAGSPITRRWAQDAVFTVTADGTSLAAYEYPARIAAAAARAVLAQAAAEIWDVDWADCEVAKGFVTHAGKRLAFGALAATAARFDPPEAPVLRQGAAKERAVDPLRFPRLDLPAKVDGSLRFAGDVRLPGMVYAAIRHGPIGDSTLAGFDSKRAQAMPGVISLVKGKRWLAVVAESWWVAERALAEIAPTFNARGRADSGRIEDALDRAVNRGAATRILERGDPETLVRKFALARRYDVAPALHATLETATVTARLADGRLELWLATQAPEAARRAAATAAGVSLRDCVLYPMPAGGSFDRRLEHDQAIEAAAIARAIGRPVQLIWSRWQEHVAGLPRPPVTAVLSAMTDASGAVAGWKARLALPATAREFGRRLFDGYGDQRAMAASDGESDALAVEGAIPPYLVPNMVVEHVPTNVGLPTGRLRGNAHGYTCFFNESFADELAHHLRQEPLAFRIAMLGHDARLVQCLQRVAVQANWGGGVDASGQGIACHVIGANDLNGGRIAVVATARRDENGVRVDRIDAVADIGRVINADIARQQIEGGLVYGIGLALGASTGYAEGLPLLGRLGDLALPLLADCPTISVDFIDSEAPPADPGELGVAVAAPALSNALFSATGLRFRKLPLLSEEI
jgi:isoquinoline 1-oxidoreductase beta subunit